jgi:hypothetical protein
MHSRLLLRGRVAEGAAALVAARRLRGSRGEAACDGATEDAAHGTLRGCHALLVQRCMLLCG